MNANDTPAPISPDELADFVRHAVRHIAAGADYEAFLARGLGDATARIRLEDANAFDPMASRRRALVLGLLRSIWRQTPHPGNRYAPMPLPALERNASCPCGSGRKYKGCCLAMEHQANLDGINTLPLLLDALPSARWPELATSRVDIDAVASTVIHWNRAGDPARSVELLRPWFDAEAGFTARREALLALLIDAYGLTGRLDDKADLIARAMKAPDRTIRAAATQRQVMILSDRGDFEAAWALFREALRQAPDSPSLSHVEITLLASEGREDELRERALFWAKRLGARRDPQLAGLVELMLDVHATGSAALDDAVIAQDPALPWLMAWIDALPEPQVHYTLTPEDDSAGPLEPTPALAEALDAWFEACDATDDLASDGVAQAQGDRWLSVLGEYPILAHAFEVVAMVAGVLEAKDVRGELVRSATALLDHGTRLLDAVLSAHGASHLRLEWAWQENRPALTMLLARARLDFDAATTPAVLARLRRLLALNPNDNFGMREELMHRLIEAGDFDAAIALCGDYPDDRPSMRYNLALALFGAGREYDAQRVLHAAIADAPKLVTWLLKRNPKPPAADPRGVAAGSEREAWLHREHWLPLWVLHDALGWLDRTRRRVPR